MGTKACNRCREDKFLSQFRKNCKSKDGHLGICKECCIKKELENRESRLLYHHQYYKENREKERKRKRKEYRDNKEYHAQRNKKYREENRDYFNDYQRTRIREDVNFRLARNLRNRVWQALRKTSGKSGSHVKDLGCSLREFKLHLENQFQSGMSWENYGGSWHIDHIVPLCSFDLTSRKQFLEACHYTNLRPLWKEDNWSKGGRYADSTTR